MSDDIEDVILNGQGREKEPMFSIKTANAWLSEAESQPIPKMLFSEFWHEGELCILFADTNVGKSILAVQIGDAISKGKGDAYFKMEAAKQRVLYYDFELSAKQFQKRYSDNYKNPYRFDENFLRIEFNTNCNQTEKFEIALFDAIENSVIDHSAKVLIIDNITYLKTQSTDTAKEALPLMNALITLKRKHGLSILALAHTPKRNQSQYISVNDLAGSKHLANFADSIFAIGLSHKNAQARYIKHIKARATEKLYDTDYVMVCRIEKDFNFLGFTFQQFEHEKEHLRQLNEQEQSELERQILELYKENPSLSEREIAKQLDTNHKKVGRVLKRNRLKE